VIDLIVNFSLHTPSYYWNSRHGSAVGGTGVSIHSNVEDLAGLVDAASKLAWPLLAGVAAAALYPAIKRVLDSRGFKVKVGEMEITVQEASDQLASQVADLQRQVEVLRTSLNAGASRVEREVSEPVSPDIASAMERKRAASTPRRILWVDDVPSNNAFEVAKLRGEGIEVIEATSTEEGVRIAVAGRLPVALVVTDMGRREEGRYIAKAGLQLIETLRAAGLRIPIFVYTSSSNLERNREDVARIDGNGVTASPVELFEMISRVIGH
jgi:CheY-like chemotaxis protein